MKKKIVLITKPIFKFFLGDKELENRRQKAWDDAVKETQDFLRNTYLASDGVPPVIGWRKLVS